MTLERFDKHSGLSLKTRREQNANIAETQSAITSVNTMLLQSAYMMAAGTGFAGTGTIYKSSITKDGSLYKTTILIDLTGAKSSTTDLDIIGTHASLPAHIGQVTAAKNGTVVAGRMTCLELPVTGVTDIDLYMATEGTGYFDDGIVSGTYAENALVTSGGAWATGTTKGFLVDVPADKYLYLCNGAGSVPGTYAGGKFLIEIFGSV
jgi:hypothetical protein